MSNYKGPLDVVLEPIPDPDGLIDTRGRPLLEGHRLRYFATTNPGGERIEVELRAGRNGIVFVAPVADVEPVEAPGLPPNEEMRQVPPAARTTPFSVDDFAAPEERARRELFDPSTPEGRAARVLRLEAPRGAEEEDEFRADVAAYLDAHGDPAEDPELSDDDPGGEVDAHIDPAALARADEAREAAEAAALAHVAGEAEGDTE